MQKAKSYAWPCSLVGHGTKPLTGGPGPWYPLSNRACRYPAHGLPMIFEVWLASDGTPCPSADHLQQQRVFQDAPYANCNKRLAAGGSTLGETVSYFPLGFYRRQRIYVTLAPTRRIPLVSETPFSSTHSSHLHLDIWDCIHSRTNAAESRSSRC